MWLFNLLFSSLLNSDMSRYGYLEVFRESLGIRDNERRLYMHVYCICAYVSVHDSWAYLLNVELIISMSVTEYLYLFSSIQSPALFTIICTYKPSTVNPRYNDSICSKRYCHYNEFAVVKNSQ